MIAHQCRNNLRRFEPSSRTTLIGEQPNPWELLHPQDVMSRPLNSIITNGVDYTIFLSAALGIWKLHSLLFYDKSRRVIRPVFRTNLPFRVSRYGVTKTDFVHHRCNNMGSD